MLMPRLNLLRNRKRIRQHRRKEYRKCFLHRQIDRENTEPNRSPRPCPVCEKTGHVVTDCETFMKSDLNTGWNLTKNHYLYFNCLKYRNKTHNYRGSRCEIDECRQWLHKLLHFTKKQETKKNEIVTSIWTPERNRCFLKIVPVRISGPKRGIDTYALLDDGSTVTLIDSDLAQQIGARSRNEPFSLSLLCVGTHRSDSENESRNQNIEKRSDQTTRRVEQPTNICNKDRKLTNITASSDKERRRRL
ncbi:hypothetical protein EVAR_25328_1 [Eumeta japonica]|uniref:CCHC-type domain-containing protein n=1 Tax=Eumeta variegata TaxID=151549 RepID=A0A4C1VRM6_EUMVA|nr:hypothetical protein EVAR_25328_1 [Eumeta japonica]